MNGPVITEKELFDSLDTEIDDISVAVKLFSSGKRDEAVKALADYVRKTYDRKSVFNALLIESENEPPLKERTEAEEALRLNLVSVGIYHQFEESVDWYKNPTENQYEEWTWQLSRHYQVVSLGRMYYYTKNEKYAECAVKLIDSWLDQAIRPEADVDGHATLCWRTIECGIRLQKWAQILALIIDSPAVSDEFLCKILRSVLEHYERLSTRYTDANWLLIEMEGLYITTLVFPFLKPSPICSALAKRILSEQIKKQTFLDGVQYELTMGYHSVCYDSFSNALRIGIAFNDRFPAEFSKMLISYLHTLIKVATPAENTPHVNDGMQVNLKDYIAKQIPLFPEDELLRKYVSGANIVNQNDSASWAFEFSGLVVFRENYSKDAVYGFFDGGKYGRCHNHEDLIRCHQHEDKLNFLMSIGEKDIVCEAGGYAYDVSKMRTYSRSTLGHNTAVIDGMDQNRLKSFHWDESMLSDKEPMRFSLGGDIEYAEAVYDEGYGKNAERIAKHHRSVWFVRKSAAKKPYFIVLDEIEAVKESRIEVLWHFDTDNLRLTESGCETNEIKVCFSGDIGEKIIFCGSSEPFDGWHADSMEQNDYRAVPCLHYVRNGKTLTLATLLSPNDSESNGIKSFALTDTAIAVTYADSSVQIIEKNISK